MSCDDRLNILLNVPLCRRSGAPFLTVSLVRPMISAASSLAGEAFPLSLLRDRSEAPRPRGGKEGSGGIVLPSSAPSPADLSLGEWRTCSGDLAGLRRNMWTVSEVEETQSRVELRLKDML